MALPVDIEATRLLAKSLAKLNEVFAPDEFVLEFREDVQSDIWAIRRGKFSVLFKIMNLSGVLHPCLNVVFDRDVVRLCPGKILYSPTQKTSFEDQIELAHETWLKILER